MGVNALPGEGYDQPRRVDAAIGCSLLVAADALARVGLLDEAYFAYHEEIDWCVRARKAGYYLYYQPFSRVYHHYSKSTDVARPGRTPRAVAQGVAAQSDPAAVEPGADLPRRAQLRALHPPARGAAADSSSSSARRRTTSRSRCSRSCSIARRSCSSACSTYRSALARYCLEAVGWSGDRRPTAGEALRALGRSPVSLLRDLPRDIRQARAEGLTVQVDACVRGHWDGVRGRPLPLERLGLR